MTTDDEIERKQQEIYSLITSCSQMIGRQRQSETADALNVYVSHRGYNPYSETYRSFTKERILEAQEAKIKELQKLAEAYKVIWDAMVEGQKMFDCGRVQKPKKMFGLF